MDLWFPLPAPVVSGYNLKRGLLFNKLQSWILTAQRALPAELGGQLVYLELQATINIMN